MSKKKKRQRKKSAPRRSRAVASRSPTPPKQQAPSANLHLRHEQRQLTVSQYPMPSPEELVRFAQIEPTFPERFMRMAEKQADHRRAHEMRSLYVESGLRLAGTLLAAGIVGVAQYLGYHALELDHPTAAATMVTGAITGLAAAFIYGAKVKAKKAES